MRHFLTVMAVVAVCAVGARADLVESFEGVGLPPGWTLGGGSVGGVSGAVVNLSPTAGAQFGFIDSTGTTAGALFATEGSILLSPVFTLGAGDTLTMDLNFLTNDGGGFNDYAIVELLFFGLPVATLFSAQTKSEGGPDVVPAASPLLALTAGVVLTPLTVGDFDGTATGFLGGVVYGPGRFGGGPGGSTGWIRSSYVVPVGLSYQLRFLVSDVGDTGIESGLAFDNIDTLVPEPGMSTLVGLGLLALRWRLRRRTATAGR